VDGALVEEILQSVDGLIHSPGRFGGDMTPDDAPGMFFQDRYLHPVRPDFRRFAENSGLAAMAATATNSKTSACITITSSLKILAHRNNSFGIKIDPIGRLTVPKFAQLG